jgi:Tol biopolymer transport system component
VELGITMRVSVDSQGNQENYYSETWGSAQISADGRYAVFNSYASNLVPGDANNRSDIFVHDRLTGQTTRVNVSSAGKEANDNTVDATISADGRYVAFDTYATNLVPGDTNNSSDVFVHDRLTGETTRVSFDSLGNQGDGYSGGPSMSADGRYVAFNSNATNLVPGDTNNSSDVFVHDRLTGETTRVSVDSAGNQGDGDSAGPWISADARFVTFESKATNLVPGDTNGGSDVFVHDRLTGETTRVSVDSAGSQARQGSSHASISADGWYVAFMSIANNLVPGDTNGRPDVFLHDRVTGETTRMSVDSLGHQGKGYSWAPSLSGDGRYVAFASEGRLAPDDSKWLDVFVHDRQTKQTTLVNVTLPDAGSLILNESDHPSISADGRYVAFESFSSELVLGDTDAEKDVFVRGPELALEVEPRLVLSGQTITLTVYTGVPGNPAALWAVDVNGSPILILLSSGRIARNGLYVVSGAVPPGLSGNTLIFRGSGIGQSSRIIETNDVTVRFR